MKKKSINRQRLAFAAVAVLAVLVLSACSSSKGSAQVQVQPLTENTPGFWNHYVLWTFSKIIIWLAKVFNGSYGTAIIVFTIIIRLILTPLYTYQVKNTEKMQAMQPELKELQEKYASRDVETQEKLREETAKLHEKYDYNTWSGCLPLLIQLPILTALYQSIRRTEVIYTASFLWMELGKPDPYFVLPLLTALSTWESTRLNMIASGNSDVSSNVMQWTMPALMFLITMNLPSAVGLYLATSNIFTIFQVLAITKPFQKKREREDEEQKQKDLERRLKKAKRHPRGRNK